MSVNITLKVACVYACFTSDPEDFEGCFEEETQSIEYANLPESEKTKIDEEIEERIISCKEICDDYNPKYDGLFRKAMKESWNYEIVDNVIIFKICIDEQSVEKLKHDFIIECGDGIFNNDGIQIDELGKDEMSQFGKNIQLKYNSYIIYFDNITE